MIIRVAALRTCDITGLLFKMPDLNSEHPHLRSTNRVDVSSTILTETLVLGVHRVHALDYIAHLMEHVEISHHQGDQCVPVQLEWMSTEHTHLLSATRTMRYLLKSLMLLHLVLADRLRPLSFLDPSHLNLKCLRDRWRESTQSQLA